MAAANRRDQAATAVINGILSNENMTGVLNDYANKTPGKTFEEALAEKADLMEALA